MYKPPIANVMNHINFSWNELRPRNLQWINTAITTTSFYVYRSVISFWSLRPGFHTCEKCASAPNYPWSRRKCHFNIIIHLEIRSVKIMKVIPSSVARDTFQHLDQIWSDCPLHFLGPVVLDLLPRWNFKRKKVK